MRWGPDLFVSRHSLLGAWCYPMCGFVRMWLWDFEVCMGGAKGFTYVRFITCWQG